MNPLHAIEALRVAISNNDPHNVQFERPASTCGFDYAVWRFLNAWRSVSRPPGPDLVVLLRQVARWGQENILIGALPQWAEQYAERANISISPSVILQAVPFCPPWLTGDIVGRDEGLDAKPKFRRLDESLPGEPFLNSLNLSDSEYQRWNSHAQKEAAWMVLTAEARSTTLIALPTGSGKSLCFQMLARFSSGLTVVVVPTVALAIDHRESALKILGNSPGVNPQYFASGDPDISPETVLENIKSGTTRLLFTSPEACVSGRLRAVLEEASRLGRLENLVIDEAHMIESWGIYFRVDFQMLATLRRKWLETDGANLRTYLLSATFTSGCRQVLQELYGSGGQWREFISQRLRPEIAYYLHRFQGDSERFEALSECAWNLPRPVIFYTTEVDEAKRLAEYFRFSLGFSRVGCFHGDTPGSERRALLRKWRNDELDIMVATSAFGLGVDKPDVRAVVHACLPENLHRYYQEVGRTGRDGCSSISLLMPTDKDIEVAEGLAPKLLREDTLQKRWDGLFSESECVSVDDYIFRLRTDSRHMGLLASRTWGENVRWNKRLILQLKRAGLLEILDLEYRQAEDGEEPSEWISVKLAFNPTSRDLGAKIKPQRDAELADIYAGLDQMKAFLKANKCAARFFRELYGAETLLTCGGCSFCRRNGRYPSPCPNLAVEAPAGGNPSKRIVAGFPDPSSSDRSRAEFIKLIRRCVSEKDIRRFVCGGDNLGRLMELFDRAFGSDSFYFYRVDTLDQDHPLRIFEDETVCFFHMDELNHRASEICSGKQVIHLIRNGISYMDANGRYFLESGGAVLELYEHWLREV